MLTLESNPYALSFVVLYSKSRKTNTIGYYYRFFLFCISLLFSTIDEVVFNVLNSSMLNRDTKGIIVWLLAQTEFV